MVKLTSLIIGISLIANLCSLFAMDQGHEFMLQPIRDTQDLKGKLGATYERVLATIEQNGIKLATLPKNSVFAVVSDVQGTMVGFIGCHQEIQRLKKHVILDKLYLRRDNDTNQKRVAQMLLGYALEKHTKAKSIWIPLEKTSTFDESLQAFGFKPSQYQSKHHDPAEFQSWEVDIHALTQIIKNHPILNAMEAPNEQKQADSEHKFTLCPIANWNPAMIDILKRKGIEIESMPAESTCAVLFDERSKLVGFIGCNGDEKQIEISKLYVQHEDDAGQRDVVRLLLIFALEKHPQAKSLYTPLLKESTLIPILEDCGFETSSYLDANHDQATYDGYECSFEMFYLSNVDL